MNLPSVYSKDELADFIYTGSESEVRNLEPADAIEEMYDGKLDGVYWLGAPDVNEELERYNVAESTVLHNPTEIDMVLYGPEDKWGLIRDRLDSTASDLRVEEKSYHVGENDSFVDNMEAIESTLPDDARIALVGSDYCMERIQRIASRKIDAEDIYVLGAETGKNGPMVELSENAKSFFQERSFEPWKTFR